MEPEKELELWMKAAAVAAEEECYTGKAHGGAFRKGYVAKAKGEGKFSPYSRHTQQGRGFCNAWVAGYEYRVGEEA